MEEIKILVFALMSFLSNENLPIAAKTAEIEIDQQAKQIRLHQYDVYSLEQYKDAARVGLDSLMRAQDLVDALSSIKMTSKYFYEEDGKLNATMFLKYTDIRDLRKISFYADETGALSYPFMKEYEYDSQTGKVNDRYIQFDANENITFTMARKEYLFDGIYSLLDDWKSLKSERFVDLSDTFSKKDFEKVRKFIFKNGDRQTYRNLDNNNPQYKFKNFDVYLGAEKQTGGLNQNKLHIKEYTELVILGKNNFAIYLTTEASLEEATINLKTDKVYWFTQTYKNEVEVKEYLTSMVSEMRNKK